MGRYGLGALALAGVMALGLRGMGAVAAERTPEPAPEPPAVSAEIPETGQTEPRERTLRSIRIHVAEEPAGFDGNMTVTVKVGREERTMTLEDYLTGVLLGEMPASFPEEALKAQAVAARTYALKTLEAGKTLSDDPAVCQAYLSPEAGMARLGGDTALLDRLRRAVRDTEGKVLTFDGGLIDATYFSCSGGRTESAAAVWGGSVPYLVSVESPGEEGAAAYETAVEFSREELMEKLDLTDLTVGPVTLTEGGGVATLELGGRTFTGRELRQLLGLGSTCFTLEIGDRAVFTVRGRGHRVGMSQYGAAAMAEKGSSFREILAWYYPGTVLSDWV